MEQRDLERSGLRVSTLGYGAGAVGGLMVRGTPAEQIRAIARALDIGITYFDTAPGYGDGRSEESLGRALGGLEAWGRVAVGTKVRLHRDDLADPLTAIRGSCAVSLRRLGGDAVDFLQLHNQIRRSPDGATLATGAAVTQGEALGAVADSVPQLVADGLVAHVGFPGLSDAAARARWALRHPPDLLQRPEPKRGRGGGRRRQAGFHGAARQRGRASTPTPAIPARPWTACRAMPTISPARVLPALRAGACGRLHGHRRVYSDLDQLEDAIRWTTRGPLPAPAVARIVAPARRSARNVGGPQRNQRGATGGGEH